ALDLVLVAHAEAVKRQVAHEPAALGAADRLAPARELEALHQAPREEESRVGPDEARLLAAARVLLEREIAARVRLGMPRPPREPARQREAEISRLVRVAERVPGVPPGLPEQAVQVLDRRDL